MGATKRGLGARLLLAVIHQNSTSNPVLKSNSNDAAPVKIIYHKVVFEPIRNTSSPHTPLTNPDGWMLQKKPRRYSYLLCYSRRETRALFYRQCIYILIDSCWLCYNPCTCIAIFHIILFYLMKFLNTLSF